MRAQADGSPGLKRKRLERRAAAGESPLRVTGPASRLAPK